MVASIHCLCVEWLVLLTRTTQASRNMWKHAWTSFSKGKAVPVLNYLSAIPWRRMGEWRYSSTILDLDTRWSWVVSFTPRPLYPEEKAHSTYWIRGVVGPKTIWTLWRGEKSCPCRESNPSRPVRRYTDWATPGPIFRVGNRDSSFYRDIDNCLPDLTARHRIGWYKGNTPDMYFEGVLGSNLDRDTSYPD
jgi:hypothetical protein